MSLETGEWFIASEHSLNKFKHGAKSFFVFVFLPSLFLQFIIAYFYLPQFYPHEILEISNSFKIIFESNYAFFNNGKLLSETLKLFGFIYLKFFIFTSPIYFISGTIFWKIVKNKTKKLLDKTYISGAKIVSLYDILIDFSKYLDVDLISKFLFNLQLHIFSQTKDSKIKWIKDYIGPSFNFEIGKIPLLKDYEISHVLIPGASRKGKSQLMRNPIFKAKELSKLNKAKGIITDEKGEWFSKTGDFQNGDLIFNPADARTLKWTIFNDIENIIDIENFAVWTLPDSGGKDPFWINSARDIFKNCLIYLWNEDKKTNTELKELINSGQENMYNTLYKKLSPQAAEFLDKKDSYLSFKSYMNFITYLEDGDFSVKKWLFENSQGFIYLTSNAKTKNIFKTAMTLFVNVLGSELLSRPDTYDENKRTYLFLEEFTSLDRLDMIVQVLKLSGSKGVSVWLAFQDFQQITKIYTKDDMASIINACSSIACLGLNEPDAAEYFSKRFGEQKFQQKVKNHSMGIKENRDGLSINDQDKQERVVSPSDLLNLPQLNAFIKLEGTIGIVKTEFSIQKDETINEPFVVNELLATPLLDETQKHIKKISDPDYKNPFDFDEKDLEEIEKNLKDSKNKSSEFSEELLKGL